MRGAVAAEVNYFEGKPEDIETCTNHPSNSFRRSDATYQPFALARRLKMLANV
jgi:hypothetical protein